MFRIKYSLQMMTSLRDMEVETLKVKVTADPISILYNTPARIQDETVNTQENRNRQQCFHCHRRGGVPSYRSRGQRWTSPGQWVLRSKISHISKMVTV